MNEMTITIISAMAVFTVVTLVLVCLLLLIKGYLTPKGKVKINTNEGKKEVDQITREKVGERIYNAYNQVIETYNH